MIVMLAGLAAAGISSYDLVDISKLAAEAGSTYVDASVGPGVVLCLGAAIVIVVGAIVVDSHRRAATKARRAA